MFCKRECACEVQSGSLHVGIVERSADDPVAERYLSLSALFGYRRRAPKTFLFPAQILRLLTPGQQELALGTRCCRHCLIRLDVVVHSEKVRWVVFILQGNEPVVVWAVSCSREGVSLV